MSDREDYEKLLPTIQALPSDETRKPNIPIGVFLQEASNLLRWSSEDNEHLTMVGLPEDLLDILSQRIGACREAEALWFQAKNTRLAARKQWDSEFAKALKLRSELIHTMRFALRANKELLPRIAAMGQGQRHAKVIQQLNDLATFGRSNISILGESPFDRSLLDLAAATSAELAQLRGQIAADDAHSRTRSLRDKSYTLLKQVVEEIREAGQFVFRDNSERRQGYVSHYHLRQNAARSEAAPAEPSSSETRPSA